MGFSNTSGLERVRHYEEAHRYFTQTAKPRSKDWGDNQRPLGTARQHHYRIEKSNAAYADYYDVILYDTTMARFYAPNSAGETRICYNGDNRITSGAFMARVLWIGGVQTYKDTEGIERYVPIGAQRYFSTDLRFNVEGQLMVKCSTHAPIVSLHASKAFSEWKAQLKRKLDPLICLMEIAVQDTLDAGVGSNEWGAGRAFRAIPTPSNMDNAFKRWVEADCPPLNEEGIEVLRDLYVVCAEFIIDRRLLNAAPKSQWHRGVAAPYTTPKASSITTSVLNYLAKFAPYSVKRQDERELPQFPTELPSKWRFV